MTFKQFCKIIDDGIKMGEIKLPEDVKLTEQDLAIQYAIGKEQEARGTAEITVTTEDIWELVGKYCGKDVQGRLGNVKEAKDDAESGR